MTCIVGLESKGSVWMGADSIGISGMEIRTRSDTKVFKNEDYLFGCCGSFRMINLLKYDFLPPQNDYNINTHEFVSTVVVDEVRRCFRDGGLLKTTEGVEVGGTFLLGYEGTLFYIDEDFQTGTFYDGYASIGCGSQYALGVLYALKSAAPKRRIHKALETAEKFSAAVREPFIILHT